MRTRCVAAVILGIIWCLATPAHADPRAEIAAKAKAAMASYDSMDYETARRLLNQALAIAKKARLDKDPIVARVYLDLGITQLAGSDQEAARVALLSAAQIDPKIAIDAAYKSPELVKLLDEARAAAGDSGAEPTSDGIDCKAVRGLRHTVVDAGRPGAPQQIEALIGSDLSPSRVAVMYRPEGAIDFTEVRLTRQSGCRYAGTIPASAMRGRLVHYYIAAYDAGNKVLASKGSSGSPNIMELRDPGPAPAPGDAEDPINGARAGRAGPSADVAEGSVPGLVPRRKVTVAVAGGTGFGYVTGRTEGDNQVQKCCIGTSPVVLEAELGYYPSSRLSLGLAVRTGFPIGANIAGHSTLAPAGFLRARYALSSSGDGIRVMAELGGGILRNTIKLDNTMPGMDTDVVAQGPLLLGAGIGYIRYFGGSLAFLVDIDAIAGIAVVNKLGSAIHLNSGISADVRLGLAVGF